MKNIQDLVKEFRNDFSKILPFYRQLLRKIEQTQKFNYVTEIYRNKILKFLKDPKYYQNYKDKPLFGVPFFLKDNFNVAQEVTSAGSHILNNFIPNFDATVTKILRDNGAILLGKTVMDELGLGGTGREAKEGPVINPLKSEFITGGSSSGSAVAIHLQTASFAIGSDTGDSIRAPASFLGIIGFKPTLGLISRFGLISFSPSFDCVGFFTRSIADAKLLSTILFQFDKQDFVSQKSLLIPSFSPSQRTKKVKLLILDLNLGQQLVDDYSWNLFQNNVVHRHLFNRFDVSYLRLPEDIWQNLLFIYQILTFSESLSSQANLTGINFGFQNPDQEKLNFLDLLSANRTITFGPEIKRRYILGAFFKRGDNQNRFYFKAMKFRTYLENYFNKLFQKYDFVIHPATFGTAPKIVDIEKLRKRRKLQPSAQDLLLIANFLGLPSIVLPFGEKNGLPLGINVFGCANSDYELLEFAEQLEKLFAFKHKY